MSKFKAEVTQDKLQSIEKLYDFVLGMLLVFHLVTCSFFMILGSYFGLVSISLFVISLIMKHKTKNQNLIAIWLHTNIVFISGYISYLMGFNSGFYMLILALILISCAIGNKTMSYLFIVFEIVTIIAMYFLLQDGMLTTHTHDWFIRLSYIVCFATASFMVLRVITFVNFVTANNHKKVQDEKDELERISKFDYLTGLLNRRSIESMFKLKVSGIKNTNSVVMLGDIDNFKMINDIHGHECGDKILKDVAQILKNTFRKQDLVCRWGGEEFLIILPEVKVDFVQNLSSRLLRNVSSVFLPSGVAVTMTFGMVIYLNGVHEELYSAVARVDKLLYDGKKAGKDRIEMEIVK